MEPRAIVSAISSRLAPGGLFVLECGVVMFPGKDFMPILRIADTRWYPSRDFPINNVLARFSVRQSRMGRSLYPHDCLEQFMVANYDPTDLIRIYRGIDESNFTREYAEWLTNSVAATDELVIFEGYSSYKQCAQIEQRLRERAVVWDMRRVVSGIAIAT
jgi:hypothetical protein